MEKNKLMNINEEIPKEFFVFVDYSNPITLNNIELTKQFTSSGISEALISEEKLEEYLTGKMQFAPYVPNKNCINFISPFLLSVSKDYMIEYEAEYIRSTYFPLYPSRFSSIFAFGDYETCEKVSKLYNWNLSTVRKFELVQTPLNKVVKVNMEHVSLLRGIKSRTMFSKEDLDNIWKSYWRGEMKLTLEIPFGLGKEKESIQSDTIYEYIIEGTLRLID